MKGIVCAVCSHWEFINGKNIRVQVTHPTVAAVKVCNHRHNNKQIKGPWLEDAMWTPDLPGKED